jgi:RNA polymerase sigma-70 factor (ECF subfamily)
LPDDGGAVPTWEEVARTHGRFLYTVAYRLTGNDDDARDLVQEVLLRLHRGLATYRPGSLEGWLSRITTNVFLDGVRRRQRRPTDRLPDDADRAERVLPSSKPAEEAFADATLSADVQQALDGLPTEFRLAVVLCDVAGLPYQEIATSLGVPVGTVRSRIHRGRALLREVLAGRQP